MSTGRVRNIVVHDINSFKESLIKTLIRLDVNYVNLSNIKEFEDDVYLEKYIENPKHIEVQIAGDKHGNVIHLYERDCSFQRRHQKMIEETPCHILHKDVREKMAEDALKACKHLGYFSLGTIEFLLDKHNNYYFMEMNTRIQVEHPITETITGVAKFSLLIKL